MDPQLQTAFEWVHLASRWQAAALVLLAYAGLCVGIWRQWRAGTPLPRHEPASTGPNAAPNAERAADAISSPWIVYASQSGLAEAWARDTAQILHTAHPHLRLMSLDELSLAALREARQVFFIVSTTGEGEPPDNALDFVRRCMAAADAPPALPHLRFGLMALGDRDYAQFCAFGRRLDAWLRAAGAQACFDRIEVNQADPAALAQWHLAIARATQRTGSTPPNRSLREAPRSSAPAGERTEPAPHATTNSDGFQPWRLRTQRCLNPGSPGQPLHLLSFEPIDGALPAWQAGDLAQILPPDGSGRPRDYSIANLPTDGRLDLLVRRQWRTDGQAGLVSGWLTGKAQVGDTVSMRVRSHPGFQAAVPAQTPLVLIGNGSGLAGLRAHLQQRAAAVAAAGGQAPARCAWLVFGERTATHDQLLPEELAAWQRSGVLTHLDRVYSRDAPDAPYVQDRLRREAERLRDWIAHGAQVLVCGSRAGMGQGVDAALREVLGSAEVDALMRSGRIRRDLY